MPNHSNEFVDRYFSLDVLRGLAALSVVVYHWHHFFFSPAQLASDLSNPSAQPFYGLLSPFYDRGYMAVDLFFSLSGFIFFCLYSKMISDNLISWRYFTRLRLSRLYPLHLLTLLFVSLLQYSYFSRYGAYFVYQVNDLAHFVLQLLFVSNWRADDPLTFNGPIWSVSIEILLYAVFFLVCRYASIRPLSLLCLSLAGAALSLHFDFIGRGLFSFFLGGLCFQATIWLRRAGKGYERSAKAVLLIVLAGSILMLRSDVFVSLAASAGDVASALRQKVIEASTLERFLLGWYLKGVFFPSLITLLALSENTLKPFAKRMAWIGDISYSSYLIHFPLQLCIVLFMSYSGMQVNFLSATSFLAYFVLLIALSMITFHGFERPAQLLLRRVGVGVDGILAARSRQTESANK